MAVRTTFGMFETRGGHLAVVYRYNYNHDYFRWVGMLFPQGTEDYWAHDGSYYLNKQTSELDLIETLHTFNKGDITREEVWKIFSAVGGSGMAEPFILATIKKNQEKKGGKSEQ